jgi:hypothetical protein
VQVVPLEERAALAKALLLSLDEGTERGAEDAWVDELGRRAQAVGT